MAVAEFTPTERRILSMLADGKPHRSRELIACLNDDLSGLPAVRVALSKLRKKLVERDEGILCEFVAGGLHYRHVNLRSEPAPTLSDET